MNKNVETPIGETVIEQLIAHVRNSYSQSLNGYFQLCRRYAQIKKSSFESNQKQFFFKTDSLFYDPEGKINWDNVRQLLPPNMEQHIKGKYRMLKYNEIRLCCLLAFDISPETIASIKLYKKASIPSIKHLIKQKSGIQDFTGLLREITLNQL